MALYVQKFGGTSVANVEKIRHCATRAQSTAAAGNQVVVVVSAMGKTTDQLVELAKQLSPHPPRREMDMLLSTGEQVTIALMAIVLHNQGTKAISFTGGQCGLITDTSHGKARIHSLEADRIHKQLQAGMIVIVAGFQGVTGDGQITTLGRGGSDTTAVALAAGLRADVCEIYTDVAGVYTADPRKVKNARLIKEISYDEMLELASAGAGVLHSRAVEFGMNYNVPIHVRDSQRQEEGTMIVAANEAMERIVVSGAALKDDLAKVTLTHVPDHPGVAALIFERLAQRNIVVDDIIQNVYETGKANLGFTIDRDDLQLARQVCSELAAELTGMEVHFDQDIAKISVVGVGMKSHTGVASRMFATLAENKVNIQNITTSEIKITCIIDRGDGARALRLVHDAFELGKA